MTEKRTSSARARSGFTLAELLIVTGIVSILVAVSIPIMSGQVQKAIVRWNLKEGGGKSLV